jgi:hypothetical protein
MINLLPPEEKQKLFLEKKKKLAIILGTVILVSLICLTLILLSIKFYILAETDEQRNMLKQAIQEKQTSDFINLSSIIQKYNGTLDQLDSFYKKEIYFSQTLEIITDVPSPKGLYLTNFSFSRDKSGVVQASVSGISNTREDLLLFKKNIEEDKKIKNPYFSPGSWINQKNVNFSLTFEINSADLNE